MLTVFTYFFLSIFSVATKFLPIVEETFIFLFNEFVSIFRLICLNTFNFLSLWTLLLVLIAIFQLPWSWYSFLRFCFIKIRYLHNNYYLKWVVSLERYSNCSSLSTLNHICIYVGSTQYTYAHKGKIKCIIRIIKKKFRWNLFKKWHE